MNPEQAIQFLLNALVLKPGLTLQEAAAVVQAWNVIAESVNRLAHPPVLAPEKQE